jgi:hypothetical protein
MSRRRLDGESLRDAMLAVGGRLNMKQEGPSVFPELPAELGLKPTAWPLTSDAAERNRRSIYIFLKRNLRYPLFRVFDAPDNNETCARRLETTNAPQALMLLNSKLVLEMAQGLAERVLRETGPQPAALIERCYRLALGRAPRPEERRVSAEFLRKEAELLRARPTPPRPGDSEAQHAAVVDFCHVLLNLNEFLYVD